MLLDSVILVDLVFSTLAETQRLDRFGSIRHRRFLRWNEKKVFQMFMIYRISVFYRQSKLLFLL